MSWPQDAAVHFAAPQKHVTHMPGILAVCEIRSTWPGLVVSVAVTLLGHVLRQQFMQGNSINLIDGERPFARHALLSDPVLDDLTSARVAVSSQSLGNQRALGCRGLRTLLRKQLVNTGHG